MAHSSQFIDLVNLDLIVLYSSLKLSESSMKGHKVIIYRVLVPHIKALASLYGHTEAHITIG